MVLDRIIVGLLLYAVNRYHLEPVIPRFRLSGASFNQERSISSKSTNSLDLFFGA